MGTANRTNITKRSDKSTALTHPELDQNFDELGNVIDDQVNHELATDPHSQYGYVFNSVADMETATFVEVGQFVRTLGYYTPGDGGGNDYEIVAWGTGTADGGSFIDLDNGLQAKGLFYGVGVSVLQFGAKRDDTADDAGAFNSAISFVSISRNRRKILVPTGSYKIGSALNAGVDRLHIEGEGSKESLSTGIENGTLLNFSGVADGVNGIDVSNGSRIRGLTLENLFIYKDAYNTKGSGGTGLNIEGVQDFIIRNVAVEKFDIGIAVQDNVATRSAFGTFENCDVNSSGFQHLKIGGTADISFYSCFFKSSAVSEDYLLTIGDGPAGNGSDATHFVNCFFISDTAQISNIRIENSFWTTFDNCALEGGNSAPVGVVINRTTKEPLGVITAAFNNCWSNGFQGSALVAIDASVISTGTRWASGTTTEPVIRLDSSTTFQSKTRFSGGVVFADSSTKALVSCANTEGVSFSDLRLSCVDNVPGINLLLTTADCKVSNSCNFNVGGPSVANAGTNNIVQFDRWQSGHEIPLNDEKIIETTANASGVVNVAHSLPAGNRSAISASCLYKEATGPVREAVFDFIDGSNIQFTGVEPSSEAVVYIKFAIGVVM